MIEMAKMQLAEEDESFSDIDAHLTRAGPIFRRIKELINVGKQKAKYKILGKVECAIFYISMYEQVKRKKRVIYND